MTEDEWRTCADPIAMLEAARDLAESRQLRKFACACARRALRPGLAPDAEEIVALAEAVADGQLPLANLRNAPAVRGFEHEGNPGRYAVSQLPHQQPFRAALGAA